MATFRLIESKSLEEEIEDIELPMYEIIVHEEETWFEKSIREIEKLEEMLNRTEH